MLWRRFALHQIPGRGLVLGALVIALGTAWGCGGGGDEGERGSGHGAAAGEASEAEAPQIPVETSRASLATLRRTLSATTTITPIEQVSVIPLIGGTAKAWHAEVGDQVAAGALLAELEAAELGPQLAEAQSNAARARAELEASRPLLERGFLAAQVFRELEQRYDAAASALAQLGERASRQRVLSPIAGTVVSRSVERGESISVGQSIYVVADLARLEARVSIPERELRDVREGMAADVFVTALSDAPYVGVVSRISPTVDRASGTVELRVSISDGERDAGESPAPSIRSGMFVRVEIPVEIREDVVSLTTRAIVEESSSRTVFVVQPGAPATVAAVEVELGLRDGDLQQITAGIAEGDEVVVVGQSRLRDGSEIVRANAPDAAAPSAEGSPSDDVDEGAP